MSSAALAWVWSESRSTRAARLVLLALADCADAQGRVSVPHTTLAAMAATNRNTVARAINTLQAAAEIEVENAANGRGFPAVYRIAIGKPLRDDAYSADLDGDDADDAAFVAETRAIAGRGDGPIITDVIIAPYSGGLILPKAVSVLPLESDSIAGPTPVPAPEPQIGPSYPVGPRMPTTDVGAVLTALGVTTRPDEPFYWFRQEHGPELERLLRDTGMTLAALCDEIVREGHKAPDLANIQQIRAVLGR